MTYVSTNRIKELRKSKGLTKKALAYELGVKKSKINKCEKGKSALTEESIVCMASFFRVSTDYLLDYKLLENTQTHKHTNKTCKNYIKIV